MRIYYESVEQCLLVWRWVEYALSSPVMIVAMMVVSGISDVNVLFLASVGQFTVIVFGFMTEYYSRPLFDHGGKGSGWETRSAFGRLLPYTFGVLVYVPTWVVFLATFFRNVRETKAASDADAPLFVYAIVFGEVVLFSSFAIPLVVCQLTHPKHYWRSEVAYVLLSLVSKTLLNGLLLANVFRKHALDA